jgi:guanidinopropionase
MIKDLKYFSKKMQEAHMQLGTHNQGIATFLGTQYAQNLEDLDIALVGIPFDNAASGYPGTRLGPRAIRNISKAPGTFNRSTGVFPYEHANIADIGDVLLENQLSIEKTQIDILSFYSTLGNKKIIPITAGGDHSITYPILKGLVKKGQPVSLIHFDSHCDTMGEYCGSKYHHGASFLHASQECIIDPSRSIQIGIRNGWDWVWNQKLESEMTVISIEDFYHAGVKQVIKTIQEMVGDHPAYISFDIDCLDPAYAPGTGTPEIGGMTSFEAQQLIRGLRGLNVIGADIVEVCPLLDPSGITALAGATMMFELLCVISERF